mgnify:CR=1 FL=1
MLVVVPVVLVLVVIATASVPLSLPLPWPLPWPWPMTNGRRFTAHVCSMGTICDRLGPYAPKTTSRWLGLAGLGWGELIHVPITHVSRRQRRLQHSRHHATHSCGIAEHSRVRSHRTHLHLDTPAPA